MKRLLNRLTLAGVLLAAVGMLAQGTAYAAPGASVSIVAGSGTISPGLTLTPTDQTVSFGGQGVGVGISGTGTAAGVFTCSFSGTGPANTQIAGNGTASGTCGGGTIGSATLSCTASFSRVGALVVVTLACTGAASGPLGSGTTSAATGAGVFLFVPTSAPGAPITTYSLAGAGGGAGIA